MLTREQIIENYEVGRRAERSEKGWDKLTAEEQRVIVATAQNAAETALLLDMQERESLAAHQPVKPGDRVWYHPDYNRPPDDAVIGASRADTSWVALVTQVVSGRKLNLCVFSPRGEPEPRMNVRYSADRSPGAWSFLGEH